MKSLRFLAWFACLAAMAYGCSGTTTDGGTGSGGQSASSSSGGSTSSSSGQAGAGGMAQGGGGPGGSGQGGIGQGGGTNDCNPACGAGFTCCNGKCVNLANDIFNCGACGVTCPGPNPFCAGMCMQAPCDNPQQCLGTNGSCCGNACCKPGQLCCDVQGPGPAGGPACHDPVDGTCPLGCPLCQ